MLNVPLKEANYKRFSLIGGNQQSIEVNMEIHKKTLIIRIGRERYRITETIQRLPPYTSAESPIIDLTGPATSAAPTYASAESPIIDLTGPSPSATPPYASPTYSPSAAPTYSPSASPTYSPSASPLYSPPVSPSYLPSPDSTGPGKCSSNNNN